MTISERSLPLFPLNTVLFPGGSIPLQIFEERYKLMLSECMESDSKFGVTLIREGPEVGGPAVPNDLGTVAHIVQVNRIDGDRYFVSALGQERFRILEITQWAPFVVARVEILQEEGAAPASDDLIAQATEAFSNYARVSVGTSGGWVRSTRVPSNAAALSYHIARSIQMELGDQQALLEKETAATRLESELEMMRRGYESLRRQMTWELTSRFSRQ